MIFFEQRMFTAAISLPTLTINDSSHKVSLKMKLQRIPKGICTKIKHHGESAVSPLMTFAFSCFQLQELNEG